MAKIKSYVTNYENVGKKGVIATTSTLDENENVLTSTGVFIPGVFINERSEQQEFIDILTLNDLESVEKHSEWLKTNK
jgi:hypothetical protein